MTASGALVGSYRDPGGSVFVKKGRVYRTINPIALNDFETVLATGLLDELAADSMLVAWSDAPSADLGPLETKPARVLELDKLDFVSYPYEWPFHALKRAALLHLDVHLRALAKGVTLSDASAYNVQFRGPNPVFIDHLSFKPYQAGALWHGHRQFCDQFLNPLLLSAKTGVSFRPWYRGALEGISAVELSALLPWPCRMSLQILAHVYAVARLEKSSKRLDQSGALEAVKKGALPEGAFRNMLIGLRDLIGGLQPKETGAEVWSGYANAHSYGDAEAARKKQFVAAFAEAVKPKILWDVGCNTGDYSAAVLDAGAGLVIGLEPDASALEKAYLRAVDEDLNFLPLYLDAVNPSPDQGWRQAERMGLAGRASADGVIALAVLHHMNIGRNVPLKDALGWLMGLAPTGIVEFVPKNDPMVKKMLAFRDDIFEDVTAASFDALVSAEARIIKSETITEHGRRLVWYDRTP